MPFPPLLRNQRGIALLYLVILFVLLGVLVSVGSRMFGSLVTQRKITDTKVELERDVQMLTAWAVKNGRLPDSGEYPGIFGTTPMDAWGKPLVYAYDSNLTAVATGGLCGRTGTAISHSGRDVAFLMLSGGDDLGFTSTPGATGAFSGSLAGLKVEDLYQIIPLNELQARAGCSGSSHGSLRIVNNELPNVCKGIYYSVTLFGDGGVPPVSYSFSGLPAGLTNSGAVISGNTTTAKGPYPVVVTATDSQTPVTNTLQRQYILNVMSSCN